LRIVARPYNHLGLQSRFRPHPFSASALSDSAAITLFFTHGLLNFGIDFKGGTLLEVQGQIRWAPDIASMRGFFDS